MEEKIRLAVFGQKRLSREGGIEIVVKELCTRMAQNGCDITCYNRAGHHVSGAEYDKTIEYDGIRQKVVPTIEKKGLAAVSSSFFAALCSAFGRYDVVHIHAEGPAFFCWIPKLFGKRVICTIHGLDWDREKWRGSVASKFIRGGEKNAVKYADEIIVLSKDVQKYFLETYGRETHFIPNGVNRPEVREAKLITDHFGLEKDSYILLLGRLVPEKGIRYLVEAFKNVKTDKKLVIAGGSSDTDSFIVFGKVVLVSSLAVDWPFGVGLRLYIEFAKAVDYDVSMDVACAVITICMGADQSLMPRKISLCIFQPDGLRTFSC